MKMPSDNEITAVGEVLVDRLHTLEHFEEWNHLSEDDAAELQAAIWQVLDYAAILERKRLAAQAVLA